MPMKNPPHPGLNIRHVIDDLGISVTAAAEGLGVARATLYNVIAGETAITPEMAMRLEKGFGGTADLWLSMQAAHDLAQLRNRENEIRVQRFTPAPA